MRLLGVVLLPDLRLDNSRLTSRVTCCSIKVNQAGVIPVIFASSLLYIPSLIVNFSGSQAGWANWVSKNLVSGDNFFYIGVYALLIVFFTYFYVAITFNPDEVAENISVCFFAGRCFNILSI